MHYSHHVQNLTATLFSMCILAHTCHCHYGVVTDLLGSGLSPTACVPLRFTSKISVCTHFPFITTCNFWVEQTKYLSEHIFSPLVSLEIIV